MSKTILLISDQPEDASFVAKIAAEAGRSLEVAANLKAGVDYIGANPGVPVFVDVTKVEDLRAFEFEAQKRFGLFSEQLQPNQIHFMSGTEIFQNRDAILSPLFGTFYQRPEQELDKNAEFYSRFILSAEGKGEAGLTSFLSNPEFIQTVTLLSTGQKQEAAEAVRQYLIAAKIPARISNIIANAVDELLMNALFDAPVDQFGRSLYSATSRNQERDLAEREKVTMKIGFDGFYVGVSVSDYFGSIDRNRLLNHVSTNYREKEYQIRQGQAGAGLGIATIFNSGGTLIYHCDALQKTEATLLFRAYPSYREFKSQFNFFSAKFYV